jgi:hypothetical protein
VRLGPHSYTTIHYSDIFAMSDEAAATPLGVHFTPRETRVLYPDLPLDTALPLFRSHAALPVVSRHARGHVIGILTLEDVARAFRIERRASAPREGPFWPSGIERPEPDDAAP